MALNFSVTNTFSPATTIASSQVNTNFSDLSNVFAGLENKSKSLLNLLVDTTLQSAGTVNHAAGTFLLPSLTFTANPNTGIYNSATNTIGFTANGVLQASIGTTGLVLVSALPVASGGTNSAATLNNNRVMQSTGGTIVEASAITASRALTSDANGIPIAAPGLTTDTELGYVHGVTSAIQTQLGTKAPSSSPTLVTPILGAATATSLTFNPTTGGIVGTTTNDNTATGSVGEYVESILGSGSATSLSTGTAKTVTSVSLTAGDWDIFGVCGLLFTSASATLMLVGSSTTNNTAGTEDVMQVTQITQGADCRWTIPPCRVSLSTTTIVYLIAQVTFTGTGLKAFGRISARRRR